MTIRLRSTATLELPNKEVCRLLSEAICTSFSMFENMEVRQFERVGGGEIRVFLYHKDAPKPVAAKPAEPPTKLEAGPRPKLLTPEQRSEQARRAVGVRWAKHRAGTGLPKVT